MGHRYIFVVFIALTLGVSSTSFGISYLRQAIESADAVFAGIKKCGLRAVPANDPRIPRPRTPAHTAILTPSGKILAYYYEQTFLRPGFLEFKNPNGGLSHSVQYFLDGIRFQIPYAPGQVAHSFRNYTPYGTRYVFYCKSRRVNSAKDFEACVAKFWVQRITKQLCRFGTPAKPPAKSPAKPLGQ